MAPTEQYLREHGVRTSPSEMDDLIVHAVERLGRSHAHDDPSREVTEAELETLARGGFSLQPPTKTDPLALSVAEYVALLRTALTTEAAAGLLNVETSRIRQRLTARPRSLFGVKVHGEWRLPAFQFDGDDTVTNIGEVIGALDENLHPLSVFRWFTTSNPDLTDATSDRTFTPLEWLRLGLPVEPVVTIAREV